MVTENGTQGDGNTSFLRAARAGNLDKVLEHLKNNIDINTSNANGLNALHLASKDGHIHVVSELLRRGAIVDSATKKGNTALHIASLAGQEEVVKLLLQHGASVNVQSQNGFTPLYMAAQENHDSVVKLLLSNGANQSLATEDGFTPLAVAMQQGHDKVVAVLLESDTRGKVRLPALHIAAKKDDVKAATLLLDNDHNPDVTSKSGFTPLHIASHYGNQAIANLLIQKGADVNFSAKHNISPLHVAAKWGKTNMVSLLLEKGANIEAKTRDGLTPLHCAARSGHEQVVDMLLERGAPISAKTKNGLAPLHMAAQGEHVDAARILLYHRAPVDEVTVDYLTALHVAAHCGHVRVAKLLLDRNADANARALNGFTPLHIACKKNRIKVVELLLRHGASISATTESGLTPLHVAAFMGCMNIVIYLLQHDASPDVPTVRGETPLHLAARANQTDIIRILLRNGAQVDARAREQQTPLHIASRLGNVDIVMLLLQHGAQVDATTKDMYTALHIAAKEGQDEVAGVLIENGAALDAATKKGFTPLHLTAKYGHIKVAQLLLQKEADVDAQGKNGVTPLHVACHYDNQNVALLLLEKGASPHATAKNGHTPLHIAARKNQMDIAATLLEYGAQANAESKAGFTPLHLSCQEGHSEISNLLIEHKAGVNQPAKNGLTPMHLCAQEDNVNVAEILQRNGANIDMATKAGYTPLHVAAHFGQANMVRFLLQHGANVNVATFIGYTPLHQSAQQGHCHIVKLLLEHNANANAQTTNGQTPLDIARKLGYISVLDSLKSITDEQEGGTQLHSDEKYRVVAPEAMHESFMSDSEEEGGEDNMLSDQPYRYLTVDEMKSLGDDSLPIDVTRDERVDSNRMAQSAEYASSLQQQPIVEDAISPHKAQTYNTAAGKSMVDGIYMANGLNDEEHPHVGRKLQWKSFLVSFLVDARGGAMRGCRHSGVRMIIPSRSTCQPTRVTCRYVKPQRTMHPPQLMEGEALASRVLELGPVSSKFIGPIIMEVPHFASLRGKEREIIILRSDNGETWREHTIDNSEEIIHDVLQQCFEPEEIAQLEDQSGNHVCRFVTYDFPQYFAVVTRIRQEVHAIGPEGGMVSSTVVPQVQAVFPQGALTKKIKVGLQAQPVDPDLTAKLLGRGVAVSPIVTVEPRRRKFHKAITLSMPAPKAHSQGMINQYSGNTPTLRLLCSITGGPSRAQWEDVTGSTPLTFVNDCVSFTTTVSARFWLMDCRNVSDATKMATELYKEVIHVPFIAKFVVFAKKIEPFEARLRVFCMTDDREDKTLEKMELYTQVAKSRDVEVLEGKIQYIEMAGNLVPVTKSGEQLQLPFKAFRENRLPFSVRVKDQHADIVGRTLFMKEPKVAKGEPPQHPICILNIVLPEAVIPDSVTAFSDKITPTYRSSLLSFSKHQNDHYIGDIRIVDLSNLLGKDWIQLASEIDIGTEEIDEIINQNSDSIARQAQSMIRLYKDKPNYDIHSLELALKMIGRDDIMNKCKSGRLSHSRDFDEADIMKNSESVEELVQQESKRIQQIHEREEVKYSAEEKEVEESESDEEIAKRTVAERRDKIVKRLSIERQIPASSQKKEITREITEIKRKSLIEDKKAIHESEIFMQLPADNSVKSSVIPDQVIKIKMGKMDSGEVSKSQFDKELTHKFKSSSRSSEEEPEEEDTSSVRHQVVHEEMENLKIVKDITSVEKPSKIIESLIREKPSMSSGSKQLTEDFLAFEKLTQLPSQMPKLINTTTKTEKLIEAVKDKTSDQTDRQIKKTAQEFVTETVKTASKKVESIICTVESSNQEKDPQSKETLKDIVQGFPAPEKEALLDSTDGLSEGKPSIVEKSIDETKESTVSETASVKEKIKAFSEPKYEDISEKTRISKTDDKIKGEAKVLPNAEKIKSEKHFKTVESFMDSTSTKIPDVGKFVQSTKDFISSESEKTENKIKEKSSKIKSEEALTTDVKSVEFKEFISNAKSFPSAPKESNIVIDTIRGFREDAPKETLKAKSDIEIVKSSIVKESKTVYNKKSEEFEEQATDTKKADVLETKSLGETIKIFSEPKIEDIKDEIKNLETSTDVVKDSLVQDAKSVFDVKTNEIKGFTADSMSESMKKKISSSEEKTDFIRIDIKPSHDIEMETIEEHISESKDSKTKDKRLSVEKVKTMAEMKDSLNKERTKILNENDSKNIRDICPEHMDFIITETKTVAETIKSFTEPKATTDKIDKKQDAEIQTKGDSKKLSGTIKSLSESFEKPMDADHKPGKKQIIPSTKVENKIVDFEAEKVAYEYHGIEPKPRLNLTTKLDPEEKETIGIDAISTNKAAPETQSAGNEEAMLGESLEKLEEMKSIVADARKITKVFLSKEKQMQIPTPIKVQTKEETRLVEERVKTTITFPPVVETSLIADKMVMKEGSHLTSNKLEKALTTISTVDLEKDTIQQSVQDTMLDSTKLTHEFLTIEQRSQLLYEKQTADDISEISTETSQHSIEKSPILKQDSEKTSFEEFEKPVIDTKKITHDFLSMEQKHQPCITMKQEKKVETKRTSIIDEVLIQASDIITSISAGTEVPKESLTKATVDKREIEQFDCALKSDELKDNGTEIQESQEITTSTVKTLTQDFLSFEQARSTYSVSKTSSGHMKTTSEVQDLTKKQSPRQVELEPIDQRKSLTDAEFCQSVKESITKKMSEGLSDISDELQMQENDIPHSQTPPPTPIETKLEMQNNEDVQQKQNIEEDNLKDTIKTLHKTTESSFERVSTISTIETLQAYIPDAHAVSTESHSTQAALKQKIEIDNKVGDVDDCNDDGGDDVDDDDDDDDDDYEHEKSVIDIDSNITKLHPPNIENARREATVLVDNVLKESIEIVNEQQDRDHFEVYDFVDNNSKIEYNSESENYAITCDDICGLDVIKSPTIESMSGKSFDDNLSFTEEHIATTHSIVTVHETNEQIQSMSQDGEKKNQKGQTSLQISDTQETKSTGITPVPPTTVTTSLSSAGIVTAFAATDLAADGGIPKPKPRLVRTSSPTDEEAVHKSVSKLRIGAKEHETSLDVPNNLDSLILPVPKPRFQVRASDSIRNLEVLNEQQNVQQEHQPIQSDSISLRSFDYTEETSRTDDPSVSVSISIKSQPIDYPITTTATTTTSEEPGTDSIDPPSELSNDDVSVETERKTSFYIGESSRNIITKTTPTKPSTSEETMEDTASTEICPASGHIEATDVSLMKEVSVDSDEENDVFKEYVTMQTSEPAAGLRIRRQSSETRNDLLEEDIQTVKESVESTVIGISTSTTVPIEEVSLRKTSTEQSFTTTTITSTTSTGSAPLEVIHSTGEDDSIREISESMDIEIERPVELDLPLEKSDWETAEKEIPPSIRNCKVVHSPQPHQIKDLTKERITEEMVKKTLDEVQESLDAVNSELKAVLKDVKSIKESPSEFEFRSFAQTLATTDVGCEVDKITDKKPEQIIEESIDPLEIDSISSFIGVPENMQDQHGRSENTATASSGGTLTCKAVMTHCAQDIFIDKKPDLSLGFVSTGTAESQDSLSGDNIIKEERASLGFISSETAEDFSSMEEYYHEKFVKADIVTETKEPKEETTSIPIGVDAFGEITSDLTMKAFEDVVHRIKTDNADTTQNRWSVPEIDHSQSSSESYYKSFEKSESRPLSSDVEVLMTQGYSSEYQTAADASSVYRDTTDFVTAASIFESSSGKTISSHESMRSLDSHSETSANLGSIDVSDLSETLVASSTEEAEEIRRLRDLTNEDDSDASLDLEPTDYTTSEVKVLQQTQMKRSQEMIFKPKFENISRKSGEEVNAQEIQYSETEQLGEYTKLREIEKTRGLVYPMEEIKVDDLKVTEDILLHHEGARRSIDESKYSSSLDEGSIISVSLSSTSNIDTVVENFEDIVGSVGASSLAGIEGIFGSSLPEEPSFTMEMDAERGDQVLHESTLTAPLEESSTKRGHKRSDSTSVSGEDLKNLSDKDVLIPLGEGKESESESDTDPYETEYARQFRSPTDRKTKKKKQTAAEIDYSFEGEKRPFTPSQLIAEVIVEDTVTEELEAEDCLVDMRRPSQNMHNYANIPNITVTEDAHPKSPILKDTYEEKTLYKVKTEEELHKATDDRPLHEEKEKLIDIKEENFQKLVQEQYKQKLAELKKAEIGDSDYDYNKTPDSPDSFEMVDQPDISDEFVIIEEVAKEANEDDLGGKSIRIAPIKYESKHDEEVEKIIIKSAPADPKLGSQIFRDDLNFELEESPPTGSSGGAESEVQDESDAGQDMAANNKRWVEMQLTENQLRYPYDLTGGVLEDIKEEDGEFEVGSSRISSFKDSFSSTPDYDVMAARRYYAARGEHDDISMSSLQEFESLEQAISLENRNRTHQGSTDSSNGSFQRRYILRTSGSGTAQGDDISISSLKEFEGLENACIEAHLIEIKAKEEAALLSRSDESNKSNGSDRELLTDTSKAIASKVTRTVTHTEVLQSDQQIPNIETLLKQKLLECERAQSSVQIMEISKMKTDSDRGSEDCLDMNRSVEMLTSSVDESFEFSKDGTTKSDIHSLELDKHQPTREEGIESIQIEHMDDAKAKFGVTFGDALTTTATTMTTSTDADGREHTTVTTRIVTKSTLQSGDPSSVSLDTSTAEMMTRDISADSLNQISVLGHTTTSSAGTTAIYQTSAGNSQMSGSVTSCASSTLMEDSAMSTSGLTMSTSYWSHEEETFKEGNEIKPKEDPSPH